ncbi:Ig-like domain-containing protein [Pseudoalteromonas sp. Z1A8]|uniref:beta strand repeat-containing protein n=1 Tax=Pseudoalteromonas sp. Z1A8 TaxID=2686354 RepID=UPI00140CD5B8|nr:Ig-like domain-containing protein [Pseudoalteromonas sp. Z1A8]
MTAKNLFLLGSMVFLLSACGGSEETSQQELVSSPIGKAPSTSPAGTLNLSGVIGETITTKTQVSGAISSSRGIVGSATANAQATISLSQPNEVIQGNITFLLAVSDPDGINAVNLVLPSVNKSLAICTQECGTNFEQSIIGLSPYFYGLNAGDLRLEIWITDSLSNQVLADAITVSWQPYQIEGVTAQRDGQTINLSWQANENLNRYNVYLATEAGVTTTNIDDLENGQQFLGLSGTTYSVNNSLADKSYQILLTGIDGSGESGFAEIINVAPVGGELNFAPNAVNDQFEVNEDQTLENNVLTNDTDQFKGELNTNTTPLVSPQHGRVTISPNGAFTYTPRTNFNGIDAFSYQVINELGMIDTGIVQITINAVNDAPIALDNTYNINADGTLLITAPGLLANDRDIDLDPLTVDTSPVTLPNKGSITLNADGSFEYVGTLGMQGEDSFEYRIFDAQGAQAIAKVTIVALEQNSPPTASNDNYSLSEDTTLAISANLGLLANDTDPNDDNFIIDDTYLVSPIHGQLLLATNGSFSYIPDANYYGIDEFQYQVIDTFGATAIATVTLTINSMPDNPSAQNDEYQFQYNQTLNVTAENGLLKNDVNIEPGQLTVNTSPVIDVQSGILTLSSDGSFTYQPNSDSLDVDSFTYSVSNEQGLEATAQVVLSKTGSNSPAKANDDQYTFAEDSPSIIFNVLENDTDANGDIITLTNVTNTVGTARIVNNSIKYTPEPNYFGEVTLSYTISDGIADDSPLSSNATVILTITPINDTPIALSDSASMVEDASPILVDVLANDTDVDGDNLTITSVATELGMASIVGNKIEYTPTPNSNGVAIVSYTLSDGNGASASANLQITISPTNDAPVANSDSITIAEDTQGALINVLSNDTDLDGDSLNISSVMSDIGSVSIFNNLVQYTPSANENGTATITYTLTDGIASATGTLTVTITPINDAPIANPDAATVLEDATTTNINVLSNDTDVDNDSLSISSASTSTGSVSVAGSNLAYTPDANFNGQATVNYTLTDGTDLTSGVLTITVTPVNDAPIANPDTATILEDATATNINVLSNDTDVENDTLSISAANATTGTVSVSGNNIVYTPEANFNGQAIVNYTLSDSVVTAAGVLTITVTPVNDAPIASPDTATILEDATATNIDVLSNDTDVENDTLSISAVNASSGSISSLGNDVIYTPDENFSGQAIVNYTLSDGVESAAGVLTITVTPVNDAPIANPDTATILEDATATNIDVLSNDTDIENDTLSISAANTTTGTVSVSGNNIVYTPGANFSGQAIVNYTLSDGAESATAVLTITVTSVNDAPIANADSTTLNEDAPETIIDVLSNDTDADVADTLSITAVTADIGTVSIESNQVKFTPDLNNENTATVTYTVSDGTDDVQGTLTITITPINDAPNALNQNFTIDENATDGEAIGTITATDVENNTLSFSLSGGDTGLFTLNSANGLLTVNGTSPFNFETDTQHTIDIDITDDGTPNKTTTVTITVDITDEVDPLIPVEDDIFGRPLSGEIELSGAFSDGEFKDSILLNTNLYFVGYNNNLDKDIVIASYTNTGAVNTAFNGNGFKIIDLGKDEEGTAIISGNGELFIGYSSFDGTNTEACLLKMSAVGTISTNSGDGNTGTKCTALASNSVINDLEFTDNKVQGVGYSYNGLEKDSLWLKYDISSLTFEAGTPSTVDVSGRNRDDESHAIKNFGNSDLLIVGSAIGEENDLDATIRYILPDGRNNSNFNSGNTLIVDLSDEEGDDELFAIAGIDAINFTAFLGGYITRSSGEKEAAVIAIDNSGDIDDDFGDDDGIALYNIDGNSGNGNGGDIITGLEYEPMSNKIILSGTTGLDASDENKIEQLFTARIDLGDGELVSSYGDSGINIISTGNSNQSAKSLTIDENDTLWLAGKFNDSTNEPFIAAITNEASLFTDFSTDGYTSLNNVNISSDDQSMKVLKLKSGTHTNKYISASVAQYNSNNKLILTRFTSAGLIDTSFSVDGSKVISINVADKKVTLAELGDGNIIIAGTLINGASESGFIAKVDQNGYLDDSFATNGIYTTTDLIDTKVNFADVAIDSSDHIVAVGSAIYLGVTNSFAAMLKSDGKPENSFGTSGTYFGDENENFEVLYIDANKDIFIGGKFASGSDSQLLMLKIDDDANEIFSYLDTRSAVDVTNRAAKILADSSANLYLIANNGTTPDQATIIKLLTDGSEDSSFAVNGVGQYQLASSGNIKVTDAALDSAGNIILTGMSDSKGMIARILADGTIDTLFGSNALGYYQAEQCDNTHQFSSMLLQTDTEVVVSSTCFDGTSNNISLSKFNFYTDGVKP